MYDKALLKRFYLRASTTESAWDSVGIGKSQERKEKKKKKKKEVDIQNIQPLIYAKGPPPCFSRRDMSRTALETLNSNIENDIAMLLILYAIDSFFDALELV